MAFSVKDKKTNKIYRPGDDLSELVLSLMKEDKNFFLVYCDIEGFALSWDNSLYLLDECGNVEYMDEKRFEVIQDADEKIST